MLVKLDIISTACVDVQLAGIRLWCAVESAAERAVEYAVEYAVEHAVEYAVEHTVEYTEEDEAPVRQPKVQCSSRCCRGQRWWWWMSTPLWH